MNSDPEELPSRATCLRTLIAIAIALCVCAGCSRQTYRLWADRDAYRLVKSRQTDPSWTLPDRTVAPDPRSRLADIYNPDCEPVPPDDPAASCYMIQPYHSKKPVEYWGKLGRADAIDSQRWLEYLPFNESGEILLDKQLAVDLALLNNREFQTRVEQLYNQALALSANRFEYDLNWFGRTSTAFDATGDGFDADRNLAQLNRLGFTRNLATGGQFAVSLLNSFTWQLGGSGNSNFSAGNLVFNLTQPLLRGAFRYVRTESLTQSERNLLYAVRDFARFRRQFYFLRVSQFLDVLRQAQRVRIEEENLRNLELNLEEYDVLYQNETVSQIDVDQVFQNYQTARLGLIGTQQGFETQLDSLRFDLGLPARIPIKLDESILDPFQLNSPEVEKLRDEADALGQSIMQFLPPDEAPQELLDQVNETLKSFATRVEQLKPHVDAEFQQWVEQLAKETPTEGALQDEKIDHEQQSGLANQIKEFLDELDEQIEASKKELDGVLPGDTGKSADLNQENDPANNQEPAATGDQIVFEPDDTEKIKQWRRLQYRIAQIGGLKDRLSTLFVAQTQIRLFLIQIKPLEIEQEQAVEIAIERRLDLMNSRANVVDAFRAVEIAADQLQSDLDVSATADLRTDPTKNDVFRFDGDQNQYNLGVQFDGPLNRLNERNSYRTAQLAYQQQRRDYMASEDLIVNGVRRNLRQLRTNRFNFQIARQSLITAIRQVDFTQFRLRESEDPNATQNLLAALRTLRNAKDALISSWIGYETSRIQLFVDLELLMLDSNGIWINDRENIDDYLASGRPGFEDEPGSNSDTGSGGDNGISQPPQTNERPQPETPTDTSPTLDAPQSGASGTGNVSWFGNLLGRN